MSLYQVLPCTIHSGTKIILHVHIIRIWFFSLSFILNFAHLRCTSDLDDAMIAGVHTL